MRIEDRRIEEMKNEPDPDYYHVSVRQFLDTVAAIRSEQAAVVAGAYVAAATHCLDNDGTCECGKVFPADSNEAAIAAWIQHILALTPADAQAALAAMLAERDATIARHRNAIFDAAAKCGFGARSEDPLSWMGKEIARLRKELEFFHGPMIEPFRSTEWFRGFEASHELQECGHSRGDLRDPNYQLGAGGITECRCVGCEREARLEAELGKLGNEHIVSMSEILYYQTQIKNLQAELATARRDGKVEAANIILAVVVASGAVPIEDRRSQTLTAIRSYISDIAAIDAAKVGQQ